VPAMLLKILDILPAPYAYVLFFADTHTRVVYYIVYVLCVCYVLVNVYILFFPEKFLVAKIRDARAKYTLWCGRSRSSGWLLQAEAMKFYTVVRMRVELKRFPVINFFPRTQFVYINIYIYIYIHTRTNVHRCSPQLECIPSRKIVIRRAVRMIFAGILSESRGEHQSWSIGPSLQMWSRYALINVR